MAPTRRVLLERARSPEGMALGVTVAAFALRLVRRSPVWGGSDAAELPSWIDHLVCEPGGVGRDLQTLALYKLGGVESVLIYVQMSILSVLHLRVHEIHWELLTLLVGTANVYLGFLVVKELAGPKAGLLAAALVAVCPLDVIQSRHLGAPWMYEEFCQLTLVYLLLRLSRAPTARSRLAFHTTLAVYFWTGNQMLGIFPVLLYGMIAAARERDASEKVLRFLGRCYGGRFVALPALSLGVLLYVTFALHQGHLAHALFDKPHDTGFYVDRWFDDMFADVGPGVTWFGIAALLVATVSSSRIFSTARLPVVLFVCYAAPFWFAIPPGTTLTRGYITYGVGALLLVLAMAAFLAEARPAVKIAFPACAVLMLLVADGQSAFHLYSEKVLSVKGFQGSYTPNNGVKTAAMWIRSRPPTTGRVFSDASGGTGLEPPVMGMYFHRPHFSLYDAFPVTRPYERFKGNVEEIDYLLVLPTNRALAARYFGDAFEEALRVTERDKGELLVVYARKGTVESATSIDVGEGDRAFDARYSLLCGG